MSPRTRMETGISSHRWQVGPNATHYPFKAVLHDHTSDARRLRALFRRKNNSIARYGERQCSDPLSRYPVTLAEVGYNHLHAGGP